MKSKIFQIAALVALTTNSWARSPMPTVLQRLAGTYTEYSLIPYYTEKGMEFDEDKSTLKIEAIDFTTAKLDISTVEGSGHGCMVEGIAKVVNDEIVLTDTDSLEDGKTCTLKIKDDDNSVLIEDTFGNCRKIYCGARAGLETEFAKNSRKLADKRATTTLEPMPGNKLCFNRSYSTDHTNKNPKQLIGYISVHITANDGGNHVRVSASNVGNYETDDVRIYSGGGFCSELSDASGKCHLDADSGGFKLQNNRDGSIFLSVAKHMKLTLNDQVQDDSVTLDLSGKDKDNNLFKLYPTVCYPEPAE